jgi:hypothetical protein
MGVDDERTEGQKCARSLRLKGLQFNRNNGLLPDSVCLWVNQQHFSLAIDQNLERSGDGHGQPFDGENS